MADKQEKIDGKECRYWFRPTPGDYRKCALRGEDDNCDEIEDCFIKELLGKLAQKEQELSETDVSKCKFYRDDVSFVDGTTLTDVCSIWIWQRDYSGLEPNCIMKCHCSDNPNCSYKQLKAKDESYEELRQYHNKCCEDNAKKLEEWLEKYNQVSRDFYNGDFCNTEKCQQLVQLKEENDILRKRIVTIFNCLIKANRDVIVDTLWVDEITTLWDYIAQTLGIEGDQNQIEEQVEMLYSEGE